MKDGSLVSETGQGHSSKYILSRRSTSASFEASFPFLRSPSLVLNRSIRTQDVVFIIVKIVSEHLRVKLVIFLLLLAVLDRLGASCAAGRKYSSRH